MNQKWVWCNAYYTLGSVISYSYNQLIFYRTKLPESAFYQNIYPIRFLHVRVEWPFHPLLSASLLSSFSFFFLALSIFRSFFLLLSISTFLLFSLSPHFFLLPLFSLHTSTEPSCDLSFSLHTWKQNESSPIFPVFSPKVTLSSNWKKSIFQYILPLSTSFHSSKPLLSIAFCVSTIPTIILIKMKWSTNIPNIPHIGCPLRATVKKTGW